MAPPSLNGGYILRKTETPFDEYSQSLASKLRWNKSSFCPSKTVVTVNGRNTIVARAFRRSLLVILVLAMCLLVAFIAVFVPSYPLGHSDKSQAARYVIGWFTKGTPIPGVKDQYPDLPLVADVNQILVVCDFLPEDEVLFLDRRVKRVSESQYKEIFAKERYNGKSYLIIVVREDATRRSLFDATSMLGSHGYLLLSL